MTTTDTPLIIVIDMQEGRYWGDCPMCGQEKRLDHAVAWYEEAVHEEIGTALPHGGEVGGMCVCRECHDRHYGVSQMTTDTDLSADTPETIAARVGMLHKTGMRLCGESDIARAIRLYADDCQRELDCLRAEVEEWRKAAVMGGGPTLSTPTPASLTETLLSLIDTRAKAKARATAAEAQVQAMRMVLTGLADVLQGDCGVDPCSRSMAPAEHYLGLAREILSTPSPDALAGDPGRYLQEWINDPDTGPRVEAALERNRKLGQIGEGWPVADTRPNGVADAPHAVAREAVEALEEAAQIVERAEAAAEWRGYFSVAASIRTLAKARASGLTATEGGDHA